MLRTRLLSAIPGKLRLKVWENFEFQRSRVAGAYFLLAKQINKLLTIVRSSSFQMFGCTKLDPTLKQQVSVFIYSVSITHKWEDARGSPKLESQWKTSELANTIGWSYEPRIMSWSYELPIFNAKTAGYELSRRTKSIDTNRHCIDYSIKLMDHKKRLAHWPIYVLY